MTSSKRRMTTHTTTSSGCRSNLLHCHCHLLASISLPCFRLAACWMSSLDVSHQQMSLFHKNIPNVVSSVVELARTCLWSLHPLNPTNQCQKSAWKKGVVKAKANKAKQSIIVLLRMIRSALQRIKEHSVLPPASIMKIVKHSGNDYCILEEKTSHLVSYILALNLQDLLDVPLVLLPAAMKIDTALSLNLTQKQLQPCYYV